MSMEDQKNSEPKQRMSVVRMENSAFAFFVSFSQFRSQTGITLDDLNEIEIFEFLIESQAILCHKESARSKQKRPV